MPTAVARAPQHWAVTVFADGDAIVTIESNGLSGRPLSPADEAVIERAALHLLAFLGRTYVPLEET
jgi:hypothetical protein